MLGLAVLACSSRPVVDLEECVPDETFDCECPDRQIGEATCQSDRHIGACICPTPDAAVDDAGIPDAG